MINWNCFVLVHTHTHTLRVHAPAHTTSIQPPHRPNQTERTKQKKNEINWEKQMKKTVIGHGHVIIFHLLLFHRIVNKMGSHPWGDFYSYAFLICNQIVFICFFISPSKTSILLGLESNYLTSKVTYIFFRFFGFSGRFVCAIAYVPVWLR